MNKKQEVKRVPAEVVIQLEVDAVPGRWDIIFIHIIERMHAVRCVVFIYYIPPLTVNGGLTSPPRRPSVSVATRQPAARSPLGSVPPPLLRDLMHENKRRRDVRGLRVGDAINKSPRMNTTPSTTGVRRVCCSEKIQIINQNTRVRPIPFFLSNANALSNIIQNINCYFYFLNKERMCILIQFTEPTPEEQMTNMETTHTSKTATTR